MEGWTVQETSAFEGQEIEDAQAKEFQDEIASLKSKLAYALADFDNYKKRCQREKEDAARKSIESLAKDIFPALDSFEMALSALDGNANNTVAIGINMAMDKLLKAMKKHGFEKVDVEIGSGFDVETCEAVSSEESSQESGTIVKVLCNAWKINSKLIRPAKVVVAK